MLLQLGWNSNDKSGFDEIIVKKQPYQLLSTNCEFFPCFTPPTFINWLMNLRKLGQLSSSFCTLYESVCEGAIKRLAM